MVVASPVAGSSANEDTDSEEAEAYAKQWMTLRQFATVVRVTYQTVLRWKDTEKIQTFKVGGQFRIYQTEVDRFLREGNREG
jgi:excisionase family DNA binding protein